MKKKKRLCSKWGVGGGEKALEGKGGRERGVRRQGEGEGGGGELVFNTQSTLTVISGRSSSNLVFYAQSTIAVISGRRETETATD